jgi:hypothetical protein
MTYRKKEFIEKFVNGFRGGALKHKFVECLHEFISFMYVYQYLGTRYHMNTSCL